LANWPPKEPIKSSSSKDMAILISYYLNKEISNIAIHMVFLLHLSQHRSFHIRRRMVMVFT